MEVHYVFSCEARYSSVVYLFMASLGCYNTYQVPKAEFERLQQADTSDKSVVVRSDAGEGVEVTKDTRIFVRSNGGRRYQSPHSTSR